MRTFMIILFLTFTMLVTAEDVTKVYTITNRTNSSNPSDGILFKDKLYFAADNGINGYQIWQLDSIDNLLQVTDSLVDLFSLFELNDKLFFFTGDYYSKKSLWKFNGLDQPVKLFNDIDYDAYTSIIFHGKFYSYGFGEGPYYYGRDGLYVFDGNNRPRKIANNPSDSHSQNPPTLTILNNKLYFRSDDGIHGTELWSCDSVNPPVMVADINLGSNGSGPRNPEVHYNKLYFFADDGVHGYEMWEYNGVDAPRMIADIYSGPESSTNFYKLKILEFNNRLYFKADDGIHGGSLWVYDGINPPEIVLGTEDTYPSKMFVFNGKLYFYGNSSLFEYDGINYPKPILSAYDWDLPVIFNNNLYVWVPGYDNTNCNREDLYRYDGINPPENLTSSLNVSGEYLYPDFIFLNDHLYFSQFSRLYASNNDSIKLISEYFPSSFHKIGQFHNKLYYYPYSNSLYGKELWSFDGTKPPSMLSDINETFITPASLNLKVADNKLYFNFTDSIQKYIEYDGTSFKTLPSDFNPLTVYNLFAYNHNFYFNCESGKISISLFKNDGTTTTAISNACSTGGLTVFNDTIYYCTNFDELLKYDGNNLPVKVADLGGHSTLFQTVLNDKLLLFTCAEDSLFVADFDGKNLSNQMYIGTRKYQTDQFGEFDNKIYFTASDNTHGTELWVYDGYNTPTMIADLNNGSGSSYPKGFKVFKNRLYFSANDGIHGTEPWVYDGLNPPEILKDIENGSGSSSPEQLSVSHNKLYFKAYNQSLGYELWGYDGINEPGLVSDIYRGTQSSGLEDLTVYNDELYLSAVTEDEGRQLFKVCQNCSSFATTSCDHFNFNGTILNASGKYYDTISGNAGNDSIVRLDLTILKSSMNTMEVTACNEYTFSGKSLTKSGVYYDTIPNLVGCDSVIILNLTVNRSSESIINTASCDTYTSPRGKYTWTSSGTYLDTIPNATGCDSIITINLQIDHVDMTVIQDRTVLISNEINASHQWIDCNNGNAPIEGETYLTFTAKESGQYAVIVSQGACVDTSSCYAITVTGITESSDHNITLYPNPTSGSFTIDLGRVCTEAVVTIASPDGQVIQRENARNTRIVELDLAVAPGLYMVNVTAEKESAVFKVVKND